MEEKVLYQVRDEGDLRKYYTTIPNIIDDMDLSVYAYRLYGHLKRVAGDVGQCWQSTETLAKACGMGWATVSRAKTELVGKELIIIEQVKNPQGGKDFHNITITDVWENNTIKYATSTQEGATSHQEITTSHQEIKNNPIKNNPVKRGARDARLDHPAIQVYRGNTSLYVPVNWRDEVIATVTDYEKWGGVVRDWMGKGWNKGNVKGMLDVYKNGISTNGRRPSPPPTKRKPPEQSAAEVAAILLAGRAQP